MSPKLFGAIGRLSREATIEEGTPDEVRSKRRALFAEQHIEAARKNTPTWTEVKETDFVRRGRWLVHVDSDELFMVYLGTIFNADSPLIVANAQIPLRWYVASGGTIVFLERVGSPATWSEAVRESELRRGRRGRR